MAEAALGPPVANFIKAEGFDTVEKLTQWLMPAGGPMAGKPQAGGPFMGPMPIAIVVTGGSNNNYWSYGGMAARQSVLIDTWR